MLRILLFCLTLRTCLVREMGWVVESDNDQTGNLKQNPISCRCNVSARNKQTTRCCVCANRHCSCSCPALHDFVTPRIDNATDFVTLCSTCSGACGILKSSLQVDRSRLKPVIPSQRSSRGPSVSQKAAMYTYKWVRAGVTYIRRNHTCLESQP